MARQWTRRRTQRWNRASMCRWAALRSHWRKGCGLRCPTGLQHPWLTSLLGSTLYERSHTTLSPHRKALKQRSVPYPHALSFFPVAFFIFFWRELGQTMVPTQAAIQRALVRVAKEHDFDDDGLLQRVQFGGHPKSRNIHRPVFLPPLLGPSPSLPSPMHLSRTL